mgnify:CR=1 FL=1
MIVEFVEFRHKPGMTREQILEEARATVPKWRANADLVRKYYVTGDSDMGGAFYVWPSRAAAERGHDAAWRAAVEQRTGAPPSIRYFDLLMLLDNAHDAVDAFAHDAPWRAPGARDNG